MKACRKVPAWKNAGYLLGPSLTGLALVSHGAGLTSGQGARDFRHGGQHRPPAQGSSSQSWRRAVIRSVIIVVMTIRASASTGTMRARWRRVVFLLTTVAALGLGLSVAAYSGVFGTQEAEALQNCGSWGQAAGSQREQLEKLQHEGPI